MDNIKNDVIPYKKGKRMKMEERINILKRIFDKQVYPGPEISDKSAYIRKKLYEIFHYDVPKATISLLINDWSCKYRDDGSIKAIYKHKIKF